jgi:hypothetical protein
VSGNSAFVAILAHRRVFGLGNGGLEIVHVAHLPATAATSPGAMVEVTNGFDETERLLYDESRSRLESTEPRWHFQRREGAVGHEPIGHFGNERGTAIAIVSIRHNLAVMGYRTGIQSRHLS